MPKAAAHQVVLRERKQPQDLPGLPQWRRLSLPSMALLLCLACPFAAPVVTLCLVAVLEPPHIDLRQGCGRDRRPCLYRRVAISQGTTYRCPGRDSGAEEASVAFFVPQAFIVQAPTAHMTAQGAIAIRIGARPAATSQGQPNQSAGPPKAVPATTKPRRPRSW